MRNFTESENHSVAGNRIIVIEENLTDPFENDSILSEESDMS